MSSKLEISLYFYYVFISRRVLFDYLQDFHLQLELVIELFTLFEDFQGIFFVVFMVMNLQNLNGNLYTFPNAPEPSTLSISNL